MLLTIAKQPDLLLTQSVMELLPETVKPRRQMPFNRTARGHRFDFDSRACVVCGMTHKEFLAKGRPACMGHPPEKPKGDDEGQELA